VPINWPAALAVPPSFHALIQTRRLPTRLTIALSSPPAVTGEYGRAWRGVNDALRPGLYVAELKNVTNAIAEIHELAVQSRARKRRIVTIGGYDVVDLLFRDMRGR
jgi:hypothetical protein